MTSSILIAKIKKRSEKRKKMQTNTTEHNYPMIAEIFKREGYDELEGRFIYYAADIFWTDEQGKINGLCKREGLTHRSPQLLAARARRLGFQIQATLPNALENL